MFASVSLAYHSGYSPDYRSVFRLIQSSVHFLSRWVSLECDGPRDAKGGVST